VIISNLAAATGPCAHLLLKDWIRLWRRNLLILAASHDNRRSGVDFVRLFVYTSTEKFYFKNFVACITIQSVMKVLSLIFFFNFYAFGCSKLLLMTNMKLHMCFRLVSMTLDDLELLQVRFSRNFTWFGRFGRQQRL